ncbi:MAG TPA: ABC transporter ATP-binding protein [Anaerolineaceae bacterium]|nr:ABC transporter ATP-binding protein [Anaerolineaceae bacterium]
MDNLLLQIDNITTVYGKNEMLRNVSLDVPAGTVTCLLGSNGAGKSTLIKAILGLVKITKGKVIFDGKDITGLPTHKVVGTGISIVPEGKRIFPKMSVRENLRMGAYLEKDNLRIEKRMMEIFELYPRLKERINQIAGTLSGGEQSMLSIGRGLMSDPKLMIFDEPSLGLAPILVEQNFDTIKEINSKGTTVFLVEQNVHLTLEYASRGYVLQQGEVVASGSVEELKQSEVLRTAYLG